MNENRVRAVIVNYNGANSTLDCVSSLLNQNHRPLDVVVVDNDSASDDFECLRRSLPPSVHLVRSDRNLGYDGGLNLGVRLTEMPRTQWVLALNNDLLFPDPNMLTKLIAAIEGDSRRVAASPLVRNAELEIPMEEQIQVRRVPGFWELLVSGSGWLRRLPGLRNIAFHYTYGDQRPYQPDSVYECESINGCCFLVSTDFLEKIDFLDESIFLYNEELILGRQMLNCDRIAALSTATNVIHLQGLSTGHGGGRVQFAMLREMVRSDVHYCHKYLGITGFQILLLKLVRAADITAKILIQFSKDAIRLLFGSGK